MQPFCLVTYRSFLLRDETKWLWLSDWLAMLFVDDIIWMQNSLLLMRFVFRMAEASAKRVTGDEPQGTMGRVQTAGEAPARSCVVFLAKKSFSWHGPIFGLFKSWKRSILVAYCCKHCKLWVDRWMAQNFHWCVHTVCVHLVNCVVSPAGYHVPHRLSISLRAVRGLWGQRPFHSQ